MKKKTCKIFSSKVAAYLVCFDPASGDVASSKTAPLVLTTLTSEFGEKKKGFQLQFFGGSLNPLSDFKNSHYLRFPILVPIPPPREPERPSQREKNSEKGPQFFLPFLDISDDFPKKSFCSEKKNL